jgi:hypothetical protein
MEDLRNRYPKESDMINALDNDGEGKVKRLE